LSSFGRIWFKKNLDSIWVNFIKWSRFYGEAGFRQERVNI